VSRWVAHQVGWFGGAAGRQEYVHGVHEVLQAEAEFTGAALTREQQGLDDRADAVTRDGEGVGLGGGPA